MQLWSLWVLMVARPAEVVGQWLAALLYGRIVTVKQMKWATSTLLHVLLWAIALACTITHLPDLAYGPIRPIQAHLRCLRCQTT